MPASRVSPDRFQYSKQQSGFVRQGRNEAAGCCTTQHSNTHITAEQQVLYRWHPWAGRSVVIHSFVEKAGGTVARCSLVGEASGLPLELPLWMFDRAACAVARPGDQPQAELTALSALQALLSEVPGSGPAELQITSATPGLSADLTHEACLAGRREKPVK